MLFQSVRLQTLQVSRSREEFQLLEKAYFQGVPFADAMIVDVRWDVKAHRQDSIDFSEVSIYVDPMFRKDSILNDLISKNTRRELKTVFQLWSGMLLDCSCNKALLSSISVHETDNSYFMGQ